MSTDSGSHDEGEHHHPRLHAVSETLHEHEESYLGQVGAGSDRRCRRVLDAAHGHRLHDELHHEAEAPALQPELG